MLLFLHVQSTLAAQANRLRVTTSSDGANRGSYSPSISADGRKVAFASNSDFFDQGILERQVEIWLYDTATMTVTRVTTSSDGANRNSSSPSVNADGTKIAFASDSDFLGQGILRGQDEIWLYDTATMTVTRITTSSDGANRGSYSPSINADGTKVAFVSTSDFLNQGILEGQSEIWLYDTTTMTVTRITTSSDGASNYSPSINADGTKIAFYSDSDFLNQGMVQFQFEIWLYDTTTMTVTRVTTSSDGTDRRSYFPSISADGTKVAFHSDSDFFNQGIAKNQFEIWLYDTAAMTVTRVTTSSNGANRESISPSLNADGTKIAFASDSNFLGQEILGGQDEIWLYDTATMTVTRVTTSSNGSSRRSLGPSLNADGAKVAFSSDSDFLSQGVLENQSEIWLFNYSIEKHVYLPIVIKN